VSFPNGSSILIAGLIFRGRRWIIHTQGYANLVPSTPDYVYGFLYELDPEDEKILDTYEGVPRDYHKEYLPVEVVKHAEEASPEGRVDEKINALIYIDSETVQDGTIRKEYITRLSCASRDGVKEGIPAEYFEMYWHRFIPSESIVEGGGSIGSSKLTLNFAYGSNMWKEQMNNRCPRSLFKGVALLRGW
jgi:gamma-glutamylcyclotransferase (GGCT)/AIG2-like uncharacterized protein YtfP